MSGFWNRTENVSYQLDWCAAENLSGPIGTDKHQNITVSGKEIIKLSFGSKLKRQKPMVRDPAQEGEQPAAQEPAKTSEPEQREPDLGWWSLRSHQRQKLSEEKLGQHSDGVCHLLWDAAYNLLPTLSALQSKENDAKCAWVVYSGCYHGSKRMEFFHFSFETPTITVFKCTVWI